MPVLKVPHRNSLGFRSLVDALSHWSRETPERTAFTFLVDGEREEASLTFAELERASGSVARHLIAVMAPGERAILLYPSGLDFIVAFLGCLKAGIVPVPVSVPNRAQGLEIVANIAKDAAALRILSSAALLERHHVDFTIDAVLAALPRSDTAAWSREVASVPPATAPFGPVPALLQYTSGSTGVPRGVIVTHENLVDNHTQLSDCFVHDQNTVVVSWLPMFHDMGLGSVCGALWCGGRGVLMSPSAFLQKPARWLQAISRYGGNSSGAPDFAFDLCIRRVADEDCAGLDLSSWRTAFDGSEPVRAATLSRFYQKFSRYGFRLEAFRPLYGLAEATLFVSGHDLGQRPSVHAFSRSALEQGRAEPDASERGQELVGCGRTWHEARVRIVDPESLNVLSDHQVGEIWISGPSVAKGYWGKEAETKKAFRAVTSDGQGPFLRTGDLGFLHDGSLFVTGRLKDLIIVRGRNHYPQDIEDTVGACHPALEPQRCAAFSVETDDGESLVVLQEVKRTELRGLDSVEVFRAIRKAVAARHGLYASAITLLGPMALLRTTSGKVRRKACRRAFLDGSLTAIASSGYLGAGLDRSRAIQQSERAPDSSKPTDRVIKWLRQCNWSAERTERSGSRLSADTLAPRVLCELAQQGLFGIQVSSAQGGLGLGHLETARVLEQLGGVDLRASLFVGFNTYLGVGPILRHGQSGLQAELLPELARGTRLASFALSEPGAGSNTEAWSSRAEKVNGSGFRLHGTKFVIGGASPMGLLNVFIRNADDDQISAFVVSRDSAGLELGSQLGPSDTMSDSVNFAGIFVERQRLLGALGQGLTIAGEAIRHSHLAIGAACLGGMKRVSQLIFHHATQRQTGEPGVVAHPVTMTKIGRLTAEVAALECLVRLLAKLSDEKHEIPAEAFSVCKLVGPEMLWQAVDDLVQLLGRRGLVETLQMRALVDDARVLRALEGPLDAGSAMLGVALASGDDLPVRRLVADLFGTAELDALVVEASRALSGALSSTANQGITPAHWWQVRAGELTTWIVLLGAVELYRRAAPTPDLERSAIWVRSNFERCLAVTRAGPPPGVPMSDVGEAIASYGQSVGALDSELPVRPRRSDPAEAGDLRAWSVAWLATRLKVSRSQIDPKRSFADHGMDSLAAVEFAKALADRLGRPLDETLLWNFSTIEALLDYLEPPAAPSETRRSVQPESPVKDSTLEDEIERLERELKRRV